MICNFVHHFQVFVFGSFTEDETKSLQSSPNENSVQLMFGTLDAETLRSVGFNNIPTEITKKPQPSKVVKKDITKEVVYKNGNVHDSNSPSFSNGLKEHKQKDEEPTESVVPGSLDQSIQVEAPKVKDTNDSIISPSVIPYTTATELLPRGLINSGNLCFLNATLQALLACSPFVNLLQELRTRKIPEVEYSLIF